jgi:methyl-accepting chemotaxis protein
MRKMRIGSRILLGFGIVLVLTVGLGGYALYEQAAVRAFSEQMDSRDFRVLDTFRQIDKAEQEMRATREQVLADALLLKDHIAGAEPAVHQRDWERNKEQNLKLLADLESSTASFESTSLSQTRSAQWRRIRLTAREAQAALKELAPQVEIQFAMVNRGELAQAIAHMPVLDRLRDAFEAKLTDAQRLTEEQIGTGRGEIADYYRRTRTSVVIGLVVAVLAGILCSVFIQRSITRPLEGFMRFVERVGKGDLTEQADVARRDELGDLARSLNQMVAGLKDVAGQTRSIAEHLNAATAEILASTQQQGASTAEQAAAVQQANATMAEISQSGSQISERAKQVAAAAEATSSASTVGLESVQNTTATMESIGDQAGAVAENVIALSEKTQAVGEIIATVNDIAEQSHLLALNASIEAAAAGEYGRSFSVVAQEMKSLADQSKQATIQVRSILGDIQKAINSSVMLTEEAVKRVESGRQQAEVADRAIRALTDNIQESVRAFQQIVAGSNQQQIGFEQVTQAFRNIGVASQQTAASTKQSEQAAANLNALAQQLRSAVERYRI